MTIQWWYNRAMPKLYDEPIPPDYKLTKSQRRALTHASEGLSDSEIAARMGITKFTAKSHLQTARRRLGAKNTLHAVVIALWLKLIHPNP